MLHHEESPQPPILSPPHPIPLHPTLYEGGDSSYESGHSKGPCDPIGGVLKQITDLSLKNKKTVIQDAKTFYTWARKTKPR